MHISKKFVLFFYAINTLHCTAMHLRSYGRDQFEFRKGHENLVINNPSIQVLESVPQGKRYGVCYNYALSQAIGLKGSIHNTLPIKGTQDWFTEFNFLADYCTKVTTPQKGDIVVYYSSQWSSAILHAGLVHDSRKNLVESKWGTAYPYVFIHQIDDIPPYYGNYVEYYRLTTSPDEVINDMKRKIIQIPADTGWYSFLYSWIDSYYTTFNTKKKFNSVNQHLLDVADNPKTYSFYDTNELIEELFERDMRVDVNVENKEKQTPLMLAVKHNNHNNVHLAKLFVNYGANINHQDTEGNTALILASILNNPDMISFLQQQKNCNKKLRNNDGKKASYYEYQHNPPAPYFLRRMAKPTKSAELDFWRTMNS